MIRFALRFSLSWRLLISAFKRGQLYNYMFVAQALYDFSKETLAAQAEVNEEQEPLYQKEEKGSEKEEESLKRVRGEQQEEELAKEGEDRFLEKKEKDEEGDKEQGKKEEEIAYISFQKGDKVLVEQAFDNGWWFGNAIKKPNVKGFFPSNYVKVGAKPPPPSAPKQQPEQEEEGDIYDPELAADLVGNKLDQLGEVQMGPVTSDYYQGITRYKYVRINDNNKNILNASYVKFDANTGLAKVPVKDQAPGAKAVRQMGYYFDYHQWNESRNSNPNAFKARPDPRKKKQKKLHLVGMGKDA